MKKVISFFKRHKIIATGLIAAFVAGGYFGYKVIKGSNENEAAVQTVKVERGDITVSVTGSGQVYAEGQVDLKPQIAGDGLDIIQVAVKNNQEVKKGDLIVVLDNEKARNDIRDAQLDLRAAQVKMKQIEDQYPAKTYDDKLNRQIQEAVVQQKINALNDKYVDLKDYNIRAPFDGIVTGFNANVGDSIARDEILASVITKEMYAKVTLNEVDAITVKEGNEANLTFNALNGKSAKGKVRKIDTIGTIEQGVVSYQAEISFDAPMRELKPGMSVDAEIFIQSAKNVLLLPNSAIKSENGVSYVNISNALKADRKASANDRTGSSGQRQFPRQEIKTGISNDTYIEITSGLEEGDIVLTGTFSFNQSEKDSSRSGNSLFPIGGNARVRGMGDTR